MNALLTKIADSVNVTDRNTAITGNENGSNEESVPPMNNQNVEKAMPAQASPQASEVQQPASQDNFGLAIIDMLAKNDGITDDDFHAFAEQMGMDVHVAEQAAYRLAGIAARFITGGKFAESGLTYDDLDPEQLQMGIDIEQEHTPDIEVATKIAADHLAENPTYYSYLTEMESFAKQEMGQNGEGEEAPANDEERQPLMEEQGQVQSTATHNNSETPFQS